MIKIVFPVYESQKMEENQLQKPKVKVSSKNEKWSWVSLEFIKVVLFL